MVGILFGPKFLIFLIWTIIAFTDAYFSSKKHPGLDRNSVPDMVCYYLLHYIWTPLKFIGYMLRFLGKVIMEIFD